MNTLMHILRRVPRPLLFAVAALIQVGLMAWMVFDRASVLRNGSEVTLQVRPVDPRDFLRGDYVVLSYEISNLTAGALKDQPSPGRNADIYVKVAPKDGFHRPVSVHAQPVPVTGDERLIAGRVTRGADCDLKFCERLQVKYGIERYFVPEGEGRELEKARNQDKMAVVLAVTPAGRVAIKRLLLEGKPVYEEPYF